MSKTLILTPVEKLLDTNHPPLKMEFEFVGERTAHFGEWFFGGFGALHQWTSKIESKEEHKIFKIINGKLA